MIICPHLDLAQTHGVAEKLLNEIKSYKFAHNKSLTASLGVGVLTSNLELYEIITKVDNALYNAKDNGRAQIKEFSI